MAFKHVLCAVDFSQCSKLAVSTILKLVDHPDGRVTLMHTIELPVTYGGELPVDFTREIDRRATALLDQWAAELTRELSVPVTTKITVGSPAYQILRLLEEDPTFDLVIVGSHGRTGIKRILLGSVAEKVCRHAPCPVYIARSRT